MKWFEDEGVDVTAAFRGFTAPTNELIADIERRGWTVNKVKVNTDGQYEAEVQNPHGEKLTKTGPTDATALGNALLALMRRETIRFQARCASWEGDWQDQLKDIAAAYAKAPAYDHKAATAWKELADDMRARADHIKNFIKVEYTNDPTPYTDFQDMVEDVTKKHHILISRHNTAHPLWSPEEVSNYRLVRDVLGHCVAGGDFGWVGENRATAAMMPMLSPTAQAALFTESIGQAAYNNHFQRFGPPKITFLNDHLKDIQDKENEPAQAAKHPSQMILPGQTPELARIGAVQAGDPCPECKSNDTRVFPGLTAQDPHDIWCFDCGWHRPITDDDVQTQLFPYTKEGSLSADPNANWQPMVDPLPDNAYLWQREQNGLDPLDHRGLMDQAHKLDTGWASLTNHDGSADIAAQKQAVSNALKVALLTPRKALRWQATHYQHVLPVQSDDPLRFWDALEQHRDHHNIARGLPGGVHRAWEPESADFKSWVKAQYPHLPDHKVAEVARRELFHMLAEEEERITNEDPENKLTAQEIEAAASKSLQKRLKVLTKGNVNDKTDVLANIMNQPDPGVYGSYLVSPLKTLAAAHKHLDELSQAAHNDVQQGGKGHHWRKSLLNLGIPGIGPREASFAWFLLQPKTSQLAVVNPQLAEILGHKTLGDRDYFKAERELEAARQASGYSHIPLGLYGLGVWDYRRGGPGYHSEVEPLKALFPKPHDQVDWANYEAKPDGKWPKPYWFESTKPARTQVADEWDNQVAGYTPAHRIPKVADAAFTNFLPYFVHNGQPVQGKPGQSTMALIRDSLGLSTEDVWRQIAEAGKQDLPVAE